MTDLLIDDGLCAVVDCDEHGNVQVCPYDGRYHHHGRIHYENDYRWHPTLRFKPGAWRGICDPHMFEIMEAMAPIVAERRAAAR